MKDIDYEAIADTAAERTDYIRAATVHVKAIIDAYEAQKTKPEWVPLDLEKVVQGQEVRHRDWAEKDRFEIFIAYYDDHLILEDPKNLDVPGKYHHNSLWLMRAPKPKTVKVWVFGEAGGGYWAQVHGDACGMRLVGTGEIEVRE